ncbi:hypothetical protein AAV32_02575 [Kerstersia gyiorum]|uniref:Uncharacterized protein n=1 Tax=Kerstersia gyiorum TaxID=206506 RepID=A0A171KWC3_9BURK|nr:hypothetical protein AAV32_02575 [Kerstersia gyiorum]
MYHRYPVAQTQKILTFLGVTLRRVVIVQVGRLPRATGDDGKLQDEAIGECLLKPGEVGVHAPGKVAGQALLDFQVQQHQRGSAATQADTHEFVQVAAVATAARSQGAQFLVKEVRRAGPVDSRMQARPEKGNARSQQGFEGVFPVSIEIGGLGIVCRHDGHGCFMAVWRLGSP